MESVVEIKGERQIKKLIFDPFMVLTLKKVGAALKFLLYCSSVLPKKLPHFMNDASKN